ncbi:MAG: TIM-barrel domain-containing protein [Acidobacteriaceae bacterium]
MLRSFLLLAFSCLLAVTAVAQGKVPATISSPTAATTADTASLTMQGTSAVTFSFPGEDGKQVSIPLFGFRFNGEDVPNTKLHLKQLAPGVYEIYSLAYTVGTWEFRVGDNNSYYGFGERFDTLNRARTIVVNSSQDNGGPKGSDTYQPMPFYMSLSGYGLWLDTYAEASFDLNVTNHDAIVVHEPAAKLRIVLFAGPKFPKILDEFTGLIGRSKLPPYWAFAPWMSRDYHRNDADVYEDVDRTRKLDLPASVIMIDSPWATNYNTYIFNKKQFADPEAMIKHIHEEGYKLVLWHTSWIDSKTNVPKEKGFADKIPAAAASNYAEAAKAGYFVKLPNGQPYVGQWWKGMGSLIDFTNPAAKKWWQDQVRQAIKDGADGFKDDDAEGSFLGDVKFYDGTDQRLMRDKYAVLYNQAMQELIDKDLKGNGVLFMRSASVGNNNFGILWGGDNEASFSPENGLPTVVTAGLNAGLSGMPVWAGDLGGYLRRQRTPDDAKLFMRWTEYSAFSPVMEIISSMNLGPWDYGDQALAVYKKYATLHMSLFPYRYAAAQQSAKDGMPIMRALVLQYQDDHQAREAKSEYLFGPDLLVVPVLNQGTQRVVYLPKGDWIDYWSGTQTEGGKTIIANAAVDVLPLYVRSGAVLPKIPEDVMTLVPPSQSGNTKIQSLDDRRVYEVYPGAAASFTDFEGRAIQRDHATLTIDGKPAKVFVRWKFIPVGSATVNGATVRVQQGVDGPFIAFEHKDKSVVAWK